MARGVLDPKTEEARKAELAIAYVEIDQHAALLDLNFINIDFDQLEEMIKEDPSFAKVWLKFLKVEHKQLPGDK